MIDSKSVAKAAAESAFRYFWSTVALAVLCLVVAVTIWATASYFEASAYNRVTGSSVSTWDAMWIELRVQAAPSGK